jgi:hypothetical protein
MELLMKKTEEMQLNANLSELKLQIKEKEATIRDLTKELETKEKEYQTNLE